MLAREGALDEDARLSSDRMVGFGGSDAHRLARVRVQAHGDLVEVLELAARFRVRIRLLHHC